MFHIVYFYTFFFIEEMWGKSFECIAETIFILSSHLIGKWLGTEYLIQNKSSSETG